ncbi:hypothetical protein THAR02_06703 [Trichoderma harzianum]|uniref:Uncharacterized protein n=1 Tax=Trichoderma harzianum TaxID=5544 RepID=A0A0F9ZLR0_TRIHA|nr:hypothetical protein THAR02_06703 [Trichoderma harzianum]
MPESEVSAPPKAEATESHVADKTSPTQRATPRYASATATSTVARTSVGPGARSPALNKTHTRSSPSVHRSTASTSGLGHRSGASVGAGDDAVKSASRRESTVVSAEKKAGATSTTATARRSTVGVGAASPKPTVGQRTKPSGSSESIASTRTPVSRGTVSSSAAADARKRPAAPGIVTGASRPSTRTSVRDAHIDSPKLDELNSKLADKDKEIESLKTELTTFESTVAELRQKLETNGQQAEDGGSNEEQKDAPDGPKTDYDAIIRDLEAQLQEKADKLSAVDAELTEAARAKEQGGETLEALQKELESLKLEHQERVQATESQGGEALEALQKELEALKLETQEKIKEAESQAAEAREALQKELDSLKLENQEKLKATESQGGEALDVLQKELESLKHESEEKLKVAEAQAAEARDALQKELESLKHDSDEKLKAAEAQAAEARDALQKELESVKLEGEEKLKAKESEYEQAIRNYASQVEKLQASVSDKAESDTAVADLQSKYEATVQNLQQQVDELTASKTELESTIESVKAERDALNGKIADLENDILEFKTRLATSETAIKEAEANAGGDKLKIQEELAARDAELEATRKSEAELQSTVGELKATLTSKDEEVSTLKAMHDERLKQISQDYENEIESLRGDAFFKRRFEELEKQHNELQSSVAQDSEQHAKALTEAEERHSSAVKILETKQAEYEAELDKIRNLHAEELTSAKASAAEALDAHVKELDAIKARCDEQLRLALADGEASSAEFSKSLQISHEKLLDELKRQHEEEKQELVAAHQSNLTAATGQHESALAALQSKLEETNALLEKTKASNIQDLEEAKRELHGTHAAEIEKLAAAHTDASFSLKEEGLQMKQQLDELKAAYRQMETALDDSKAKNATLEEQLSAQVDTAKTLQESLQKMQEQLVAAQAEADDVSQQLAGEKMERMVALAELDAVKRPQDSTALNNLKAELAAVRAELQATQAELKKKEDVARNDYNDLNDSMTTLLEEANKKSTESQLQVEQFMKKLEDADDKYDQLLAQFKIKNAELAEAEAQAALYKSNSSRTAGLDDAAEGDEDHSSTALALLSKVRLTAKQVDTLDREMRDRNLQLLNSITDVKMSS